MEALKKKMKMLKMQDKRGEMEQGKVVAIILVVLVIAVVAIMVFKQDIIRWVRSLPGYEQPNEPDIDMSQLSDEEVKSFCPVRVGFYKNAEGEGIFKQYYIFVKVNDEYKQTPFYLAKERIQSNEYSLIRKAQGGADSIAGRIVDNEIVLYADFRDTEIEILNSAWLARGNLICKREEPE